MKRQRHRDHGLLLLLLVLEITNQWPRNHIKWPASLVAGPSGATVAPVWNQRPVNVPKVVNEWLDSSRKQEICLNPNFGLFRRLQHGSVWIFMEQGPKGKIGKKRRWNCLCFSSFSVTCAHVDKFWCFFFFNWEKRFTPLERQITFHNFQFISLMINDIFFGHRGRSAKVCGFESSLFQLKPGDKAKF